LSRPLRADAARNRAKVLAAAEAVFAERGIGASTEEIALRAGVGVGTVFRHFPTKESLLADVYVGRLRRLAEEAESLCDDLDPGGAFLGFFARTVEQSASKNAVVDALASAGVDVAASRSATGADLRRALSLLLARAQQTGAIRTDLDVDDVIALLAGASQAFGQAGPPEGGRRALAVVLDGMTSVQHRSL
jgi:AcrR family transcriptional regulator